MCSKELMSVASVLKIQYIPFEAIGLVCEWRIDIRTVSKSHVNILYLCYQALHEKNFIQMETHANELLQLDSDNVQYYFLYALSLSEIAWKCCIKEQKDQWGKKECAYPYNYEYYQEKADFYFYKCTEMKPRNPIYLLQYANFANRLHSKKDKHKQIYYYETMKSLFEQNTYVHTDGQIDIYSIQFTFIANYIHDVILNNNYTQYKTASKKLNQLYLLFKQLCATKKK
eukprot:278340_1